MSNKIETPNNVEVIPQVANFANITDLDTVNFSLDGQYFVIKNENDDVIWLEVKPALGTDFVNTKFAVGWNTEIVKEVKVNTTLTAGELENIKWGN